TNREECVELVGGAACTALGIGRGDVAFDAQYPLAILLVVTGIGSSQHTSNPGIGTDSAHWKYSRREIPFRITHACAAKGAEIEAGPVIGDRSRSRFEDSGPDRSLGRIEIIAKATVEAQRLDRRAVPVVYTKVSQQRRAVGRCREAD